MTFREVRDTCFEFVQSHPGTTMEDVAKVFIDNQEENGLSDLDLGKLLYHLEVPHMMPDKCLKALVEAGYINKEDAWSK